MQQTKTGNSSFVDPKSHMQAKIILSLSTFNRLKGNYLKSILSCILYDYMFLPIWLNSSRPARLLDQKLSLSQPQVLPLSTKCSNTRGSLACQVSPGNIFTCFASDPASVVSILETWSFFFWVLVSLGEAIFWIMVARTAQINLHYSELGCFGNNPSLKGCGRGAAELISRTHIPASLNQRLDSDAMPLYYHLLCLNHLATRVLFLRPVQWISSSHNWLFP